MSHLQQEASVSCSPAGRRAAAVEVIGASIHHHYLRRITNTFNENFLQPATPLRDAFPSISISIKALMLACRTCMELPSGAPLLQPLSMLPATGNKKNVPQGRQSFQPFVFLRSFALGRAPYCIMQNRNVSKTGQTRAEGHYRQC